jgi:acetyl-CoA carboxylase biotin carboxyl carrier protein
MDDLRSQAGGAGSEEDLLLLTLFGDAAARLLENLRGRGGDSSSGEGIDSSQSERIRELVRLVEGSDVGELTVEDGPLRITVRKQEERPPPVVMAPHVAAAADGEAPEPEVSSSIRLESPMVGTFYRSPSPSQPAFVDEGDRVEVGQTLCILEAMKLFNEFKSDHAGVVRRILVDNAQPVEYGQPLFELEPV